MKRTLGLTNYPMKQLIAGWTTARRMKFDVGVARGPWGSRCFIEGLGMGLFTETMSRLAGRNNKDLAHSNDPEEKIISVLQILKHRLQNYPVNNLKVTLDQRDVSGEYILMEVMNIRCIGPNLCLAPDVDPGDGLLDIVFLPKGEEEKLSRYLSESIEGRLSSPGLTLRRGRQLQIEWNGFAIYIDDEVWPGGGSTFPSSSTLIEVEVHCRTVEFLAPA